MRKPTMTTIAGLALALVLTGCNDDNLAGDSSESPQPSAPITSISPTPISEDANTPTPTPTQGESIASILDAMNETVDAATSVRVKGETPINNAPAQLEVWGAVDGSRQHIIISQEGFGHAEMITVPEGTFVTGDDAYWTGQGIPAERLASLQGKWVKMPEGQGPTAGVSEYLTLFGQLQTADIADYEREDLDGVATVKLTEHARFGEGALWLTDDDAFTPVGVRVVREGAVVDLRFSDWNVTVETAAPPADQVIVTQ